MLCMVVALTLLPCTVGLTSLLSENFTGDGSSCKAVPASSHTLIAVMPSSPVGGFGESPESRLVQ